MQDIPGKMCKMKRYAELMGNHKSQRIKSLQGNKLGIHDPAAILLGALDPDTKTIHFYREFYQTDKVLDEVAASYKKMTSDIPQGY